MSDHTKSKKGCIAGRGSGTAGNAGELAVNGSPREKKVLAQKVSGSNLVLDCIKPVVLV